MSDEKQSNEIHEHPSTTRDKAKTIGKAVGIGVAAGAAQGALVGGPIGAAAGAAVGAVLGGAAGVANAGIGEDNRDRGDDTITRDDEIMRPGSPGLLDEPGDPH